MELTGRLTVIYCESDWLSHAVSLGAFSPVETALLNLTGLTYERRFAPL
jgi:hypothetical protein